MNGRKMLKKLIKEHDASYVVLENGDDEVKLVYSSSINNTTSLVKKGEKVFLGQKIGQPVQHKDVSVYSSVSGIVKSLEEVNLLNGEKAKVVVIENDKGYESLKQEKIQDSLETYTLDNLKESGIIDNLSNLTIIDILQNIDQSKSIVINLSNIFEEDRYLSILENNYEDIKNAVKVLKEYLNLNVRFYIVRPSEKLMNKIKCLMDECGFEVIKGQYPYTTISRNAVIAKDNLGVCEFISLETLVHINRWTKHSEPMTGQFITIINSKNNDSITIKSPLGNSIQKLIETYGKIGYNVEKVVEKDLLCGENVYNLLAPLNKSVSTIIVFGDNFKEYEAGPCIKCGSCHKVCEMKLIPFKLEQHIRKNEKSDFIKYGGEMCIECGLCSYVCPAKRKLVESISMMKKISR